MRIPAPGALPRASLLPAILPAILSAILPAIVPAILTAILMLATGCSSVGNTKPARSASEQLLISTAADRASAKLLLPMEPGTVCHIVDTRFESYDKPYAVSTIHNRLLEQGIRVVGKPEDAAVIIEIRSGALSTNSSEFLIGIPSFPFPIPGVGTISTPEIAIFKRNNQEGIAKFALFATRRSDNELIGSSGPVYGDCYVTEWAVLLIPFVTEDVLPEDEEPEVVDEGAAEA